MKELENKKDIRYIDNKQRNGRNPFLLVMIFHVNELNSTIKGRDWEDIFTNMIQLYVTYETHFRLKYTNIWKIKE